MPSIRGNDGRFLSQGGKKRNRKKKIQVSATQQVPPTGKAVKVNLITIALDDSSSMSSFQGGLVQCFNGLLNELQAQERTSGQLTYLSIVRFGSDHSIHTQMLPVSQVRPLTSWHTPGCQTDLYGGIMRSIEVLENWKIPGDVSRLMIMLTDGGENAHRYTPNAVAQAISDKQRTGAWTFAFQVPANHTRFIHALGIPVENIREWEQSQRGMAETFTATLSSVGSFYTARAGGQSAVTNFYAPVTTNLSAVSVQQVRKSLTNLSNKFRSLTVNKEQNVKDFVESMTGAPYILGSAYYTLMKKEKIQPTKQVLIMEKGGRAVWGGQEARDLIGLPQGQYAKVTPGNHSDYDIYVQSTSTNRILPRGTKVLIDLTHLAHSAPTWGTAPQ